MGYPEQTIEAEQLARIAAIERFAGKVEFFPGLSERLAAELGNKAQAASIASLLRLEGRGVGVDDVENAIDSVEHNRLDFGWCSDEIIGMHRAWRARLQTPDDGEEAERMELKASSLSAIHKALFDGVPVLAHSAGCLRGEELVVRAFDEEGTVVGDVFEAPGPVEVAKLLEKTFRAMRTELTEARWHPLLLVSWLLARLLAIQPFQAGSIRSAHLFCAILLQDLGYRHVRLRSLEEIMAEDAGHYFVALRKYRQSITGDEDGLAAWHGFFLACLERQASELEDELENACDEEDMPPLQQRLLELAGERGQLTVRDSVEATDANRNTLKVHLGKLVRRGALVRKGVGKGTWYEPS